MMARLRLGISSCLLGEPVRYDGRHKLDRFLRDTLGRSVEYLPVCPEVECGLPVPREPMHLCGDPGSPRLLAVHGGRDLTATLQRWIEQRLAELEAEDLRGFIFKARSPSCGLRAVRIVGADGGTVAEGAGLFARAFTRRFPLLPVEEEGPLADPQLRRRFLQRVGLPATGF